MTKLSLGHGYKIILTSLPQNLRLELSRPALVALAVPADLYLRPAVHLHLDTFVGWLPALRC